MKRKNLVIIGEGGHAKVIYSEVKRIKNYKFNGFIKELKKNEKIKNFDTNYCLQITKTIKNLKKFIKENLFIVAIGNNQIRKKVVSKIENTFKTIMWETIISKNSNIATNVKIGKGTIIVAGSTVNFGTKIGNHCIINTNCSIDHENIIEDYSNCSPGTVSAGNVIIKEGAFIGIGTSIKQSTTIGKKVTVGGHSYVNKNCSPNSIYYGAPIKKIIK